MASMNSDIRLRSRNTGRMAATMVGAALVALGLSVVISLLPFTARAAGGDNPHYVSCHNNIDDDGGEGIDLKATSCSHVDNDIPDLHNASLTTLKDTATSTTLVADDADNDLLYFEVTLHPSHGTLSLLDPSTAYAPGNLPTVTYTPAAGYTGPDTFEIKANDGLADEDDLTGQLATFNVTVLAPTPVAPSCDSNSTFDSFSNGSVNGQGGWSITGAYDQAVESNFYGFPTFGCKTLRMSDSVTSGSFGDWLFTPSAANEAGEAAAATSTYSGGTRQNHFEAQFDIASAASTTVQTGLHISVSPDRGDGARMSYLRFEDQADGIHVFFDDVQGTASPANFVETDIATLDRAAAHTVKFSIDFADGVSNDIVKIYIDGALVHTGTTWEDYYRYDTEQAGSGNQVPTVDSLILQARGTATPANAGKGFIFDNFSISTGMNCASGQHVENNACVADSTGGGSSGSSGSSGSGSNGGGGVVSGPLSIGFVNTNVNTNTGGGIVLGTSTEALPEGCELYLSSYLTQGNSGAQVSKLQTFLNAQLNAGLPVTGFFGPLTLEAVKNFQLKYWDEILKPWVAFGLESDHMPTGYVYKTTKYKINLIQCSTFDLPKPQLP